MKMTMPVLSIFLSASVCACTAATSEPPCTDADFAAAAAAHEARLAKACLGQGPNCPERAAADADFHAQLQKLVNCER